MGKEIAESSSLTSSLKHTETRLWVHLLIRVTWKLKQLGVVHLKLQVFVWFTEAALLKHESKASNKTMQLWNLHPRSILGFHIFLNVLTLWCSIFCWSSLSTFIVFIRRHFNKHVYWIKGFLWQLPFVCKLERNRKRKRKQLSFPECWQFPTAVFCYWIFCLVSLAQSLFMFQ